MPSLSVFCDEAGQQNMSAGYYLLTLVLHDQSEPLRSYVDDYEAHILQNQLPNIAWFQSFETVPIFYDDGQVAVTRALHESFDFLLVTRIGILR